MLIICGRDSLPSWASKFNWGGVADFDIMTSPKFGQKNPKVHIVASPSQKARSQLIRSPKKQTKAQKDKKWAQQIQRK